MRSPLDLVIDAYTGLTHRLGFENRRSALTVRWGAEYERRLTAYAMHEAYYRNASRHWLERVTDADRDKQREYGDAALLVDVVRAAITGDEVGLAVPGANASLEVPEVAEGEEPAPGSPTADDVADAHARAERLEWLEEWATAERFPLKVHENELDTVKLGDGVYLVEIDYDTERVRLRLMDAQTYFPDLNPRKPTDEFPSRVDLAWEFLETLADGSEVPYVHRITFELGPIQYLLDEEGNPVLDDAGELSVRPGDSVDERGRIVRTYPWSEQPSAVTCYKTEATWALEDIEGKTLRHFDLSRAVMAVAVDAEGDEVLVRELDMGQDFMPVVHIPNTVAIKGHYGESIFTKVAQVLDDLYRGDTNVVEAADLAAVPVIGVGGTQPGEVAIRPGMLLGLGPNGRLDTIDMSGSVHVGMEWAAHLRDVLTTNSRLTAEALGRVKASDVASGVLFALTFGPMRSLIEEHRLVRSEKYPLLLKFVQRMALAAGFLEGEVYAAEVTFGSYLPADHEAVVSRVLRLWEAKLISRRSALETLLGEGIIDVEVGAELEAIEREDFGAALALLESLGGTEAALDAVYERLGVARAVEEVEEEVIVPPINLGPPT